MERHDLESLLIVLEGNRTACDAYTHVGDPEGAPGSCPICPALAVGAFWEANQLNPSLSLCLSNKNI